MKGLAGLSLGLICVGSADNEVATEMFSLLLESDVNDPNMRFVALGLALIFLGPSRPLPLSPSLVFILLNPFLVWSI